jgi:hypothetical protein
MSFTMYGRTLLLRAVFTPDAVTLPSALSVALTLTIPPANAVLEQLVEPVAASYVRQSIPLDAAHWAPTGFGELYNTIKVTFPQAVTAWGLLTGWALLDPVSTQCVSAGALMEPFSAIIGAVPYVDPGALVLGIQD